MVVISWGVGLPLIIICLMSVDFDLYNKMKVGDMMAVDMNVLTGH